MLVAVIKSKVARMASLKPDSGQSQWSAGPAAMNKNDKRHPK